MEKRKLSLDALSVSSFETSPAMDDGERGTVRAHADTAKAAEGAAKDCTCGNSCLCPSAYYYCGTGPQTIYSCDYTFNRSCVYGE
ncbi:MAG TPA: hypothetical protein VHG91_14935 [Longimicrobium sp.]|nr:hypothetical protein [Longimicrobium sp.]